MKLSATVLSVAVVATSMVAGANFASAKSTLENC